MPLHPKEAIQIHAHFTKTPRPNALNTLLRSLTPTKSLLLFNFLLRTPHPVDHFTSAITSCTLLRSAAKGREVHARILKSGHHADLFIQNSLISFYSSATASDILSARRVFAGISRPDVVSWTSLISALARNGCERDALLALSSMNATNVTPNPMTLVGVLPACSHTKLGKFIHGYGIRRRLLGNVILDNAFIDMYMDCGELASAEKLFGEMPERDVVSWTTMVSGYTWNGCPDRAVEVFQAMLWDRMFAPNEATLVSLLRACALKGELDSGKWVHSFLYRSGVGVDGLVGNALINMYAKCGEVGIAVRVFRGLGRKDLVSWCTVIGGLAMNGRGEGALQVFGLMLCHGVHPDEATFTALLSACCHTGLVDQGLAVFRAMDKVYGIMPRKEHYGCMVDMYGRAGRVRDAEELIQRMLIEPDGHMVGALISAQKIYGGDEATYDRLEKQIIHGHVTVGGGTYALVSNLLANANRWEESSHVRELMKAREIRKIVGRSWIEVQ